MLYGIAKTSIGTNALDANTLFGEQIAFDQCIAGFSLTATTNFVEAKCFVNGVLQTVASAINAEDFMLDLTYEYLDWSTMQLLYGELAQTGGAALPTSKSIAITAAGAVSEPDISTANNNGASVRVYDQTKGIFLTAAAASPPAANQFFVDAAASEIEFNASQVGSTVTYKYDKIYTSIQSIGSGQIGSQFDQLTNLNLTAIVSSAVEGSEAYVLVVDQIERTNTPTLQLQGDKAVFSIQYKAINRPGARKPFRLYRLNGATAA